MDFYRSLAPGQFHIITQDLTISSMSIFKMLANDSLFTMPVMVMTDNKAMTVPREFWDRVMACSYDQGDTQYRSFMADKVPRLLIIDDLDALYKNEARLTTLLQVNETYDRLRLVVIVFAHYGFDPLQFQYVTAAVGGYKVYAIPVNVSNSRRPAVSLQFVKHVVSERQRQRYQERLIEETNYNAGSGSHSARFLAVSKVRSRRELNVDYPEATWQILKASNEERQQRGLQPPLDMRADQCSLPVAGPAKCSGWITKSDISSKAMAVVERIILEPVKRHLIVCRFKEHYGTDYLSAILSLWAIEHVTITGDTPVHQRQNIINDSAAKVIVMDWIEMKNLALRNINFVHLFDIPDRKKILDIFTMVNNNIFNTNEEVVYIGYLGYLPLPTGQLPQSGLPGERTADTESARDLNQILEKYNRSYREVYDTATLINFTPMIRNDGTAGYTLVV